MAPNVVKRIHKTALDYTNWKSKHNPDFKPWINESQIPCPKIDWNDVNISQSIRTLMLNSKTVDEDDKKSNNDQIPGGV